MGSTVDGHHSGVSRATRPMLTKANCVPRDARDASGPSCETWCAPAHCQRWCKCASCGFCAASAAGASGSGDCSALGREERTRLQGRWAPTTGRSGNATCGAARLGYLPGAACGLRAVSPSSLHGRLMFVGDPNPNPHPHPNPAPNPNPDSNPRGPDPKPNPRRTVFVGDSVSRDHFMSLVAAVGRSSHRQLTCAAVGQPTLHNRSAP